ncbi:hypothetical protein PRIPAC_74192 [Pristionchus pacificus]|uniref:Uncharacterized protein n=1 Tax=Pristionchus pacificus TaxID=54126 RepID=A0A2A6BR75_PRIPA|nr:hypothetical protein PRIPAC_74192 [Pristionchus pacificus]|eukprot:PDM68452.1 hypothetical protein PRIPAC_43954 [Pristionchus pacificus]
MRCEFANRDETRDQQYEVHCELKNAHAKELRGWERLDNGLLRELRRASKIDILEFKLGQIYASTFHALRRYIGDLHVETLRISDPFVFCWEAHCDRFHSSLAHYEFTHFSGSQYILGDFTKNAATELQSLKIFDWHTGRRFDLWMLIVSTLNNSGIVKARHFPDIDHGVMDNKHLCIHAEKI